VGTEIAGFRVERELGRGKRAVVYEATQVSLDRRVALKILPLDDEAVGLANSLEWPEHPHVVSLYAVGPWRGGAFVATRLVDGASLAHLEESGELDPARVLELLTDVASALDAAHRAGIVHGAVAARNVLVDRDGQALLSDFGMGGDESTVAPDRRDFAALLTDLLGDEAPPLPDAATHTAGELVRIARAALPELAPRQDGPKAGRRRRRPVAAGVLGLAGLLALAVILAGGGAEKPQPVPPVAQGTVALGSDLDPGEVRSVDCGGQPPSGSSQACTLVQMRLPGRRLVPKKSGAIRRWAVRGARGQLALQVVRRRGDRYVAVARTRYESVTDDGCTCSRRTFPSVQATGSAFR